ncbi:MAG: M48 family metallopeptidase [Vicinamibacterales bacterium]
MDANRRAVNRPRQLVLPLTAPSPSTAPPVAPLPPGSLPRAAAPAGEPSIRFLRRRGTRRYILRVVADGSLRVTLPWWGSQREARAFVASQAGWIARQRARQAAVAATTTSRHWPPGHAVLIDGVPHPIAVDTAPATPAVCCAGESLGEVPEEGDLRPLVEGWLRRRAARDLPAELQRLAGAHAVTVTRIAVRNQQSRWGSCSRRGAISLNWRLVQVPPFVREYVLVHELMHRRELNHSARFWRHVAAAVPRYVEARRWLRTEGQTLF